ncbi:hypothetical protein [Niveispirillum sp. KHB5.9]|uniref:hypothetical protein n=1 Tax=Niveispirillum sp. KHB5.9 TaxID=3400269 RepID=UPI003A870B2C
MTGTQVATEPDIDRWRAAIRSDVDGQYALAMGVAIGQAGEADSALHWLERAGRHPRWQAASLFARHYVLPPHGGAAVDVAEMARTRPDEAVDGLCQLGRTCRGTASIPRAQVLEIHRRAVEVAAGGSPRARLRAGMEYDEVLCAQGRQGEAGNTRQVLDTDFAGQSLDRPTVLELELLAKQLQGAGQTDPARAIDRHLVRMIAGRDVEGVEDATLVLNILGRIARDPDTGLLAALEPAALEICRADPQAGVKLVDLAAVILDKDCPGFARSLLAGLPGGPVRTGLLAHIVLRTPQPVPLAPELAAAFDRDGVAERFRLVLAQALLAADQIAAALALSATLGGATALLVQITGLLAAGRVGEAREALDRLRKASPPPQQQLRGEALLLLGTGDADGALAALEPAIASAEAGIFERMLAAMATAMREPEAGRTLFAEMARDYPAALVIRAVNSFPAYRAQVADGLGGLAAD